MNNNITVKVLMCILRR